MRVPEFTRTSIAAQVISPRFRTSHRNPLSRRKNRSQRRKSCARGARSGRRERQEKPLHKATSFHRPVVGSNSPRRSVRLAHLQRHPPERSRDAQASKTPTDIQRSYRSCNLGRRNSESSCCPTSKLRGATLAARPLEQNVRTHLWNSRAKKPFFSGTFNSSLFCASAICCIAASS